MQVDQFRKILSKKCGISDERKIIVGVSGGPDSLTLLDLLIRSNYDVTIGHLDHQLRTESASEAEYVNQIAKKYGVPFVLKTVNINELSAKNKMSLEEAARFERYRFLFGLARQENAQFVAVAHNADDQVETVLMNMVRGSGLDGLTGISYWSVNPQWDAHIPLIRPLLGMWRNEILAYCRENKIAPVWDMSNYDEKYLRNKFRNQVIPDLEKINPSVKQRIWKMSQLIRGDLEIVEAVLEDQWQRCLVNQTENRVVLSKTIFLNFSESIQQRILRKAMKELLVETSEVNSEVTARAVAFLQPGKSSGQIDLVNHLLLIIESDRIVIGKADVVNQSDEIPLIHGTFMLPLPGMTNLQNGWWVESKVIVGFALDAVELNVVNPYEVYLAADHLGDELEIRQPQAGDRFKPFGLKTGTMKLSDFWINEKLPQRFRMNWPLVMDHSQIIWVPGFRPAEDFRVTPQTKRVVKLTIQKGCAG